MNPIALLSLSRLGASVLLCALIVRAEPLIVPPPSTTPAPAAATDSAGATAKPGAMATFDSVRMPTISLVKWGIASLDPHFVYRLAYATNLLNPLRTQPAASYLQTYSPGALLAIGEHWVFDYTYSRTIYSNSIFSNETDHEASVTGAYNFNRWSVSTSGYYSKNSSPLVETARQTPQKGYGGDVAVTTHLGEHTNLVSRVASSSRRVGPLPLDQVWITTNTDSWNYSEQLEYRVSKRLSLGMGFASGYDRVNLGPDMEHIEPMGFFTWQPSEKITMSATAGLEIRTFKGGRNDRTRNPLYDASIQYAPLPTTKFTLGGKQVYSASYFASWATLGESWTASLEQRLFRHFFFSAEYSNQSTKYVFTKATAPLHRVDEGRITTLRLNTPFLGRGSASVFFQTGHNLTSVAGFSTDGHAVGAELSYRF